jgi:hypothetical protein
MSGQYTIDLSALTAADVPELLAADGGDIAAADRLMRLTVSPPLEEIPLAEWNEARKAMVQAAIAAIFRTGEKSG